ncbi:hypothetical protein JD73_31350 [Escherichia coli]|nr:hypothetical protein JD73_31350 [Escherichia coli]
MAVTLTPHQRALLQLLPDGLAWDKRPSIRSCSFVPGPSVIPRSVFPGPVTRCWQNVFPDSSRLLLEDWERYLGLPECDMTGRNHSGTSALCRE